MITSGRNIVFGWYSKYKKPIPHLDGVDLDPSGPAKLAYIWMENIEGEIILQIFCSVENQVTTWLHSSVRSRIFTDLKSAMKASKQDLLKEGYIIRPIKWRVMS